jgi:hypothetical protein
MRGEKKLFLLLGGFILTMMIVSIVSAGVGIKWGQESVKVSENVKTCLTYEVYNPWPEESFSKINVSGEIATIMIEAESEVRRVPANTPSSAALPVEFCFKTPKIYEQDCWIMDRFICKQTCEGVEMKTFEGEVSVYEDPESISNFGTGGSATSMSVSAPIRVRVECNPHSRNFSLIYITIALIALILLVIHWITKKKTNTIKNVSKKKNNINESISKKKK